MLGDRARSARGLLCAVIAIAAHALAAAPAEAQPGARPAEAITVERFTGAWELVLWTSRDDAGRVTYPFGEDARGQVTYTADGRMSAHLMRPPADPSDAPAQYVAYWGTYSLDPAAGTITHHVIGADLPGWIGSDQVRRFRFEGSDTLVLSLGAQDLTWRRVSAR